MQASADPVKYRSQTYGKPDGEIQKMTSEMTLCPCHWENTVGLGSSNIPRGNCTTQEHEKLIEHVDNLDVLFRMKGSNLVCMCKT